MSTERLQGRVSYYLVIVILLNLTYPVSLVNDFTATAYLIAWCILLGIGVYFASVNRHHYVISVLVTVVALVIGIASVVDAEDDRILLVTYAVLAISEVIILLILLEYIFESGHVTRSVLYAAVTAYLVLGNTFTLLFMLLESVTQLTAGTAAFVVSSMPDAPLQWQTMIYYSYSTLTTLGYGDVLPVTAWAQAFAAFEAITGVLYIAMLVGRLVGLYAQERE